MLEAPYAKKKTSTLNRTTGGNSYQDVLIYPNGKQKLYSISDGKEETSNKILGVVLYPKTP